jgi:hypothetical protein
MLQSVDTPPPLLPTDLVLLQAHRRAAIAQRPGRFDAAALVAALLVGAGVALWSRMHHPAQPAEACGALASGLVFAAWLCGRLVWSRVAPTVIDADRLMPLLLAEALLAHQRAGLLRLTPSPEGLRAEPANAPMPWPADSLEAALQRARPVTVAQLVADWRGGSAPPLDALVRSAQQRGIVRLYYSPRGVALVATPFARAAAAGQPASLLIDACRRQQPGLWRSLKAAIADGAALAPTAEVMPRPKIDPRAPIGVDRFGLPTEPVPGSALVLTVFIATAIGVGSFAIARLNGALGTATVIGWWAWPVIFGAASAVWTFAAARSTWNDDPLPPEGSPDEEEALARRRRRRQARPRTPPALPWRLLGASVMGVLVFVLTALVTPLGVLLVALAAVWHHWHHRRWYRIQQLMPSPREVELAVARRSRELSAGATGIPKAPAAVGSDAVPERRRQMLTAADLPPPQAVALARTDRRRQQAAAAVHRHASVLLLYVGALGAVTAGMVWNGRTPMLLVYLCGAAWLLCLAWVPSRLWNALHRTRATPWKTAPGFIGPLLRACAALLPQIGTGRLARAGRALKQAIAETPDFWRDETLELASPLGASPHVLAGVTALLGLLLIIVGLWGIGSHIAVVGVILLGMTLAFWWFLRRNVAQVSESTQPGLRLVLLRVFGSPSFDDLLDLVRPWLLCGPVAHLEGQDSVVRSIEVREALALDRIDAVLVHSPGDLERRVAALPDHPDDNGRYRRQAFQCTDAIWRSAIRTLLDRSDRVLMDLSSLSHSDLGCAYELGLLLDRVPLSRVLLLVDASTDFACLQQVLDAAEQRIAPDSPNKATAAATASAWRLLHTSGGAVRQAGEYRADWLRRLDGSVDPLALVHFMLDGADRGR